MKTWWQGLSGDARYVLLLIPAVLALVALLVWLYSGGGSLRQYEVTLGDGTRATCVVVQGVRAAGVTCIPHIVVGEDEAVDAEEDKP
jgi:hypothetical protein